MGDGVERVGEVRSEGWVVRSCGLHRGRLEDPVWRAGWGCVGAELRGENGDGGV